MNERYKLNAQLAQMLRHWSRRVLRRQQVPALLWHWKRFLPISVQQAA